VEPVKLQQLQPLSTIRPVRFDQGGIIAIDQRKLPGAYREVFLKTPLQIANAIRRLVVRGAPLLGITAAYGVAVAAYLATRQALSHTEQLERISHAIKLLRSTRPTARDLFAALNRMERAAKLPSGNLYHRTLAEAREIHQQDLAASAVMAVQAMDVFQRTGWAMTICNTGALATGGGGTALAVIVEGYRLGLVQGVYVLETRPLLQGARLTAWELMQTGVPCQILTDSAAASVLAGGKVNAIITGADRIARNGDTANKVGTYMLAVLAQYHNVPFFICAPQTTFDRTTRTGADITIEQRHADEVVKIGSRVLAPPHASVYNPAFDVTPSQLITGYICEHGIFNLAGLEVSPVWNSL
jgi:methylthioribose-1-phosphate isomerase